MDIWIAMEESYKNGYLKGYEDGIKVQKDITICSNCSHRDIVKFPNGRVWCNKMCRYMSKDGFCSEGSPN